MPFIVAFVFAYLIWLVLTAGTKGLLWNTQELIAGLIFALIVGYATRDVVGDKSVRFLNPLKWIEWIGLRTRTLLGDG